MSCLTVAAVNRRSALLRLAALPGVLGVVPGVRAQSFDPPGILNAPAGNADSGHTLGGGLSRSLGNAPMDSVSTLPVRRGVDELLMRALALVGTRYRPGGNSPETGFDCSGYVGYLFREVFTVTLPRTADGIGRLGENVRKNELQPGDLVFFNTMRRPFTHVGIYLGEERFIHSPASGGMVRTEDLRERYWVRHWDGARRLSVS